MRHFRLVMGLPLLVTPQLAWAQAGTGTTGAASPSTVSAGSPARAATAADASDDEEQEVVVRGQKPVGSVVGDIPPEVTLNPADIRAYGVNNISDLLDQLSPQTTSGRGSGGAPVVLLNGRRISSFGEIRDLPTEAILRVEILPEEVSLKYGYSADQRVVNFVLRRRFLAVVGQTGGGFATEGAGWNYNPEANYVRIRGDRRFTVNVRVQGNDKLRENQRDVNDAAAGQPYALAGNVAALPGAASSEIDPALSALAGQAVTVAGVPASAANGVPTLNAFAATANAANTTDLTPYRTLRASSQQYSTNIVYALPVFARSTLTLNGSVSWQGGDSLRGLPSAVLTLPEGDPFSPFADAVGVYRYLGTDPLHQRTSNLTGHFGATVNGDRGKWRWSLTGNYDYANNLTRTQTGLDTSALQARLDALDPAVNPFGTLPSSLLSGVVTDRARAVSNTGNLQAVVGGPLFALPAGDVSTNIKVGAEYTGYDSTSWRSGLREESDLDRKNVNGQINLDVPITSRRNDVLAWFGNFSLNANAAVRHLSDFGTLSTLGGGFNWTPIAAINLIGSYTKNQDAPTVAQLGDPTVLTPQVRVFDYQKGETVDVTQVTGGNAALRHDDRNVWKVGLTLKPFTKNDFTFIANYVRTRDNDAIASLPEPTLDLENAFPDRFIRDADGDLIQIDTRSVNFDRESRDELRLGFNVSINLKSIIQKRFEAWIADRRAGKDTPPPIPRASFQPVLSGNKADLAQREAEFRQRRQAEQQPAAQQQGTQAAGQQPTQTQTQDQQKQDEPPPPPPPEADGGPPPPPPGGGGGGGGGFGGPPGGGGGFGGPPGGGFGGRRGGFRGQAGGRLQIAIYDTWTLRDDVLIRPGVPLIDLLHGGSVGSSGGQPKHQVQMQLGYANNGIGVRLDGTYKAPTTVLADGSGSTGDLRFAALTTINLRVFADLSQLPALVAKPWARGLRVSAGVSNLFDRRQHVRDENGDTPLRYQPAYLDALGRTVSVTVRKLLF